MAQDQTPDGRQAPPPAVKYMSVPEKIELTGGGGGVEGGTGAGGHYRHMRIPDKITLEPVVAAGGGEEALGRSGRGRMVIQESRGGSELDREYGRSASGENQRPAVIPPSSSTEPAPVPSLNPVPHPTEPTGLERRVRSLEERVDRLTEVVVHRGASAPAQGNRFWYALTLAGWVMVPLIVVYMFHYKKTS